MENLKLRNTFMQGKFERETENILAPPETSWNLDPIE